VEHLTAERAFGTDVTVAVAVSDVTVLVKLNQF
jgi:hypothetical protein